MEHSNHGLTDEAIHELGDLCTADRRKVIGIINEPTASCYMKIALRELGVTIHTATQVSHLSRNNKYLLISNLALSVLMDFNGAAGTTTTNNPGN